MKRIDYSDGSHVDNPVIQIWDDLHAERSGFYRAFWCAAPDSTSGSPIIGYCDQLGGSYRTISRVAAQARRLYPHVNIYHNGRLLHRGELTMAKLSARGRTALVEVTREYSAEQLQRAHDRMNARLYPDGVYTNSNGETVAIADTEALTTAETVTRRLMSDGKILECMVVMFRPGPYDPPTGRRHNYGWKVHGTLKTGLTAEDFARVYAAPRKDGSPSSWTVTQGKIAPVTVLKIDRVQRAAERDDNTGFCLACGASQGQVEPDARNYRCESCDESEVYGAAEVLMSLS